MHDGQIAAAEARGHALLTSSCEHTSVMRMTNFCQRCNPCAHAARQRSASVAPQRVSRAPLQAPQCQRRRRASSGSLRNVLNVCGAETMLHQTTRMPM
jgi:hypothetical protein